MAIAVSTIPVIVFLAFLFTMDSFKLVSVKLLVSCIIWGALATLTAYILNTAIIDTHFSDFTLYSRYIAPVAEEIIKAIIILVLIKFKKIGFTIDAIIYGFATGTGFSLAENLYYLTNNPDPNLIIWIIRGFGTALMHGGCTALVAMMIVGGQNRRKITILNILTALAAASIIHSFFNHFYFNPVLQTIGTITLIPALFVLIFNYNERALRKWLEIEFSDEVELLSKINKGDVSSTKAGEYLKSLKNKFPPESILDMYCYLNLYLELSIKAKRNIMLRENGLDLPEEEDTKGKLAELEQLRKNIGTVGELTLSPLVSIRYRDLWKLNQLK